jgi:hypothetical protein
MKSVKKGLICFLSIIVTFIAGCYGPQTATRSNGDYGTLRGGQITPPSSNLPTRGPGGIGMTPGGS